MSRSLNRRHFTAQSSVIAPVLLALSASMGGGLEGFAFAWAPSSDGVRRGA